MKTDRLMSEKKIASLWKNSVEMYQYKRSLDLFQVGVIQWRRGIQIDKPILNITNKKR